MLASCSWPHPLELRFFHPSEERPPANAEARSRSIDEKRAPALFFGFERVFHPVGGFFGVIGPEPHELWITHGVPRRLKNCLTTRSASVTAGFGTGKQSSCRPCDRFFPFGPETDKMSTPIIYSFEWLISQAMS